MYFFKIQEVLSQEEAELRCPEKIYFKTCLPNGHYIFTMYRNKAYLFNSNKDPEFKEIYKVLKKDFGSLGYDVHICKVYGATHV